MAEFEEVALKMICQWATCTKTLTATAADIAAAASRCISERLGYDSVTDLFKELMPVLMMEWEHLEDFPFWLAGYNTLAEFVKARPQHCSFAVANAVYARDIKLLQKLCQLSDQPSPKDLIRQHFPTVLAWVIPLYKVIAEESTNIFRFLAHEVGLSEQQIGDEAFSQRTAVLE
jgi:hypothetical protein